MSNKILATYATRYGSTQEVSEEITRILRETGTAVDLQPMREVQTLEGYRAVVMGAPIYIGKWHKDAHRFLARYQETLTQRPVAIFALGPISTDEKEMRDSRTQLDKDLAKYPWLTPVAVEMFIGKYDPAKLTFPYTLLNLLPASPLRKIPATDQRDWDAIRTWASNLPAKLQLKVY